MRRCMVIMLFLLGSMCRCKEGDHGMDLVALQDVRGQLHHHAARLLDLAERHADRAAEEEAVEPEGHNREVDAEQQPCFHMRRRQHVRGLVVEQIERHPKPVEHITRKRRQDELHVRVTCQQRPLLGAAFDVRVLGARRHLAARPEVHVEVGVGAWGVPRQHRLDRVEEGDQEVLQSMFVHVPAPFHARRRAVGRIFAPRASFAIHDDIVLRVPVVRPEPHTKLAAHPHRPVGCA
mmetsp:Transcript_44989/g.105533  ORF Transcript_44989/g.105533 Transcript_44989/m.105533 type:complete len:235 (-) Transcript_44989:786-1490(-)